MAGALPFASDAKAFHSAIRPRHIGPGETGAKKTVFRGQVLIMGVGREGEVPGGGEGGGKRRASQGPPAQDRLCPIPLLPGTRSASTYGWPLLSGGEARGGGRSALSARAGRGAYDGRKHLPAA